jgi:hypothetical protein
MKPSGAAGSILIESERSARLWPGPAHLALAHRHHPSVGVEIRNAHGRQFGVAAPGKQRATHKIAKCRLAGVDQPHAFGLGEVAHAGRFDGPERFHATPGVVARDVAGFPSVVERRFQNRQNSVRGGAAFANAIRALVGLAVVRLAARLGTCERRLRGKAAVPVLDPLCCQLADQRRTERRQDVGLGDPTGLIDGLATAALEFTAKTGVRVP